MSLYTLSEQRKRLRRGAAGPDRTRHGTRQHDTTTRRGLVAELDAVVGRHGGSRRGRADAAPLLYRLPGPISPDDATTLHVTVRPRWCAVAVHRPLLEPLAADHPVRGWIAAHVAPYVERARAARGRPSGWSVSGAREFDPIDRHDLVELLEWWVPQEIAWTTAAPEPVRCDPHRELPIPGQRTPDESTHSLCRQCGHPTAPRSLHLGRCGPCNWPALMPGDRKTFTLRPDHD